MFKPSATAAVTATGVETAAITATAAPTTTNFAVVFAPAFPAAAALSLIVPVGSLKLMGSVQYAYSDEVSVYDVGSAANQWPSADEYHRARKYASPVAGSMNGAALNPVNSRAFDVSAAAM